MVAGLVSNVVKSSNAQIGVFHCVLRPAASFVS